MSVKYWVRVKPQDKAKGHVRVRQYVPEAGHMFEGGDGITQIPNWYHVEEDLARALKRYHQNDRVETSPLVFDIVDDETRKQLDIDEENERKQRLGLIPRPPSQSDPRLHARTIDLSPPPQPVDESPVVTRTSVKAAAPAPAPTPTPTPAPTPPTPLSAAPTPPAGTRVGGGRASAVANLERWSRPDYPDDPSDDALADGEDLTPPVAPVGRPAREKPPTVEVGVTTAHVALASPTEPPSQPAPARPKRSRAKKPADSGTP
jgi:hypothetical protein